MFRLHKSVLSLAAGALALGVLILAAPRAAHAIAATLVQIRNTAANPAVTQSPQQPSRSVSQSYCRGANRNLWILQRTANRRRI